MTDPIKPKRKMGFSAMDPEAQRALARKGGASIKPENRAFSRNRELAKAAGKLGGLAKKGTS